jgi:prevent-host-death family protein
MKKTSIARARAALETLVDAAERDHRRTVITRAGRPVAAIVPVESQPALRPSYTAEQIQALFEGFANPEPGTGGPGAVELLLAERR